MYTTFVQVCNKSGGDRVYDEDIPLHERIPDCFESCVNCGFKRLWSGPHGVREALHLGGERLADIDPVWLSDISWTQYTYVKVDKKTGKETVANTSKDTDAWDSKSFKRKLVVKDKEGDIIGKMLALCTHHP